jgi:SSS family solute:Na+ symporter
MAVVGALFIHIGVAIYAGAVVVKSLVGFDVPAWYLPYNEVLEFNTGVAILAVSVLTVIYTVTGGLKAVVITESIQTVVLLLGSLAVTVYGVIALQDAGVTNWTALSQRVEVGQLSMIRSDGDYAWYTMLLGYPVLGIWYWCSDQTIVQRVLGAKTERDAQLGPLLAGFLKVLPVFLMVFPGVIAYALFRGQIEEDPNSTLVVLIQQLLPSGLQGLVVAGLLAALMSTVAGALNSTATLVSIDIVKRLRPQTEDRTLVRIGQFTSVGVMIAAVAWSTQGDRFGGIFSGINHMISVLAPPISTVFIWGIFWRRGTAQASLVTLIVGFALGALVFLVDFPAMSQFTLGDDAQGEPIQLVTKLLGIPFMLQAWWLFVICSVVYVVTSLLTPAPDAKLVEQYCWGNPMKALFAEPLCGASDPRVLSLLLAITMAGLYYTFH